MAKISPKVANLHALGRQATQHFVLKFSTFSRLPIGQFSAETFKLDWVAFHS